MIFALGFLCAGMLTLLFLSMFWRRAMRLSARKLELQMPLSMTEIVAERDQLRAEFAAERRKLEQTSEKLSKSLADGRVTLGQRSKRISSLEGSLGNLQRDERESREQISTLEQQLGVIEAERAAVEKTYYDASGLLDRRSAELLQLTREHRNLNGVSDRQRTAIAGLETQIASLDMKLEASESDVSKTKKTLSEKISLAQFMERERDQFRADAVAARERREALLDNINAQQQLVDKLDAELRSGRRERAKLTETLNQLNDQLAAARSTEDRLRTDIRSQARGLEQAKHSLAEREEAQKAAQTVTQGALDAARRDNQNLRSEVNSLRRSNTPASLARLTTAAASTVRTANVEAERGRSGPVADGDVAGIRGMVADFGSDIIRAAAALDKAAGQNVGDDHLSGPKAGELEASVRELERKLSGLPGV